MPYCLRKKPLSGLIAKCIDQKLRPPHGNYKGMSYGQLSILLLTYIITQSDHRLCAVEAWVEAHRQILELSTGWSIAGITIRGQQQRILTAQTALNKLALTGRQKRL